MAAFCEWLEQFEGSFSDQSVEGILQRIRDSPYNEIHGNPLSSQCPLYDIYEYYLRNDLRSKRDLDVLLQITQAFHQRTVDLDIRGVENSTLLHDAVVLGDHNTQLVLFLIQNGVDLDAMEMGEVTALDTAFDLERFDLVSLLIEHGAAHTQSQKEAAGVDMSLDFPKDPGME